MQLQPLKQNDKICFSINSSHKTQIELSLVDSLLNFSSDHLTMSILCIKNFTLKTELGIIEPMLINYDRGDFKFNRIDIAVIENSNTLRVGQEYSSEIFLTAWNSTLNPNICIKKGDSLAMLPIKNGRGIYRCKAISPGIKTYSGVL